ncbi:hypothetical protein GNP80_05460 [Aliivibrio fischeri]|uniref:hypothetical protein n=1 Tax=Aliivibrio fischeri TaxID=668 RepID=UPI0012D8CC50|nr:hypothetical protein [Aliivibrio fischeri]MUK91885.1 hypothetical protein [Aliivibrio fischeri]
MNSEYLQVKKLLKGRIIAVVIFSLFANFVFGYPYHDEGFSQLYIFSFVFVGMTTLILIFCIKNKSEKHYHELRTFSFNYICLSFLVLFLILPLYFSAKVYDIYMQLSGIILLLIFLSMFFGLVFINNEHFTKHFLESNSLKGNVITISDDNCWKSYSIGKSFLVKKVSGFFGFFGKLIIYALMFLGGSVGFIIIDIVSSLGLQVNAHILVVFVVSIPFVVGISFYLPATWKYISRWNKMIKDVEGEYGSYDVINLIDRSQMTVNDMFK